MKFRKRLFLKSKFPANERTYCNMCRRTILEVGGDHYYMPGDIKPRPFLCGECYGIHRDVGEFLNEQSIDLKNGLKMPPLSEMN